MTKQKSPALAEGDLGGGLLKNSHPCHSERSEESTLAKLEKEFTENGGQWREFKIGGENGLFEVVLSSGDNKANDLPSGDIPLVSAGESNNGITKHISRGDGVAQIFPANILTADMFGNFFYQPREFYAVSHGRVNMLLPKKAYFPYFNRFIGAFICAFSFKFRAVYGFANMLSKTKIEQETLKLPAHKNGEIAFDFMQSYIKGLENERVLELENEQKRELKAYLQVTGLKDYELNEDEKAALKAFESLENSQNSQTFELGELFDIENTWIYGKNRQYSVKFDKFTENSTPVISGITINNGVNYFTTDINPENETFSDSLTISTRGEYSGTVTYHEGKFYLANNILAMQMPKQWGKNAKLYIATLIQKLGYGGFNGYPRKETLKDDKIKLPTKNGEIDFDFMRVFIKAVEKEVIKGVVLWSEKRLNATKQIISKP